MTTLKRFLAACLILTALSTAAAAGDMDTPRSEPPPPSTTTSTDEPTCGDMDTPCAAEEGDSYTVIVYVLEVVLGAALLP